MTLVDKIPLPNGLVAEVWDDSRDIAADTTRVTLLVKVKVPLKPDYFPDPEQFLLTKNVFGADVYYELKKERSFVHQSEVQSIFHGFLDEFRRDALPYLSKEKFPAGFARSKYLEIQKNPYKYGHHTTH
jgi:hypothetical protein